MNRILLLVNLTLLAVLIVLGWSIWKFRQTPPDEILFWAPRSGNVSESSIAKGQKAVQLAVIRSKNIFSPSRGVDNTSRENVNGSRNAPPKFELVGICSIGDQSGAIIEIKSAGGTADNKGKPNRRYFAIGDEVYGDFKLESVNDDSVVLKRKEETLEIKIDGSRFSAEVGKHKAGGPKSPPSGAVPNSPPPQRPSSTNPPARPPVNPTPRPSIPNSPGTRAPVNPNSSRNIQPRL